MPKPKDKGAETGKGSSSRMDEAFRTFQAFINLFSTLVEKLGWPGAVAMGMMYCFIKWPNEEQKHRIISMYVLGEGISRFWPNAVLSIMFLLVLFIQHRSYRKKLKILDDEVHRAGSEKSKFQEQAAGRTLKHSNSAGGK